MAKAKILTQEEKKKQQLTNCYNLMKQNSKHPLEKAPAYTFEIGDKVALGHLKGVTVIGYNKDHTVYEVSTTDEGRTDYRTAYWWEVRPLMDINRLPERITVSNTADVDYRNSTIESLLFNYYNFGVDMDPDYQRELVWDESDKKYLLDSVFHDGIEIGRFVFVDLSYEEQKERDYTYEILDGKQRLNCLCEFYENRIPYKGLYFNDLHPRDKQTFLNKKIAIGEARDLTRKEKLQLFLAVNRGGKAMNDTHMKQVEDMLYEEMNAQQLTTDEYER